MFIFVIAGSTVIFALAIIKYIGVEIMGMEFEKSWKSILSICMVSLTVVVTVFNVFAILINFKLPKILK